MSRYLPDQNKNEMIEIALSELSNISLKYTAKNYIEGFYLISTTAEQLNKSKRTFILLLKTANPSPNISLNNLPGEGRLDVLCRTLTAALFVSNGFRKDTELWAYFQSYGKVLIINGLEARGLNPDERSQAGLLKKVFSGMNVSGFTFKSGDWREIFSTFQTLNLLDPNGENFAKKKFQSYTFVLGDHLGLESSELEVFKDNSKISLGSQIYLTSQCTSIIHYLLDCQ